MVFSMHSIINRRSVLFVTAAILLAVASIQSHAQPLLQPGKRVVFIGDSITQHGEYVDWVESWLLTHHPKNHYNILRVGLSAETASGLSEAAAKSPRPDVNERLQRVLQALEPELLFVCYGMNDGLYRPLSDGRFAAFRQGIESVIQQAKQTGCKVVLLTPPPFDAKAPNMIERVIEGPDAAYSYRTPHAGYDHVLHTYAQWELTLADQVDAIINLHGPMNASINQQRAQNPDFYLSKDGVHPGSEGHALMGRLVITGLGFDRPERDPKPQIFTLVRERNQLLSRAWVENIGHLKPNKLKALPLQEAKTKAEAITKTIDRIAR